MKFCVNLLVLLAFASISFAAEPKITWKKTVLDKKFRSEGCAIGDVNKDGKLDVMNSEYWYEAPDWKPHEMQKPVDHKDGLSNYSRTFACWADDFNGDGFIDLLVIDFPGAPCYWLENPKGASGHWTKHIVWHSACNETPLYTDLFGNGKKVLIMGYQPEGKNTAGNEGQMAWFTPSKDPNAIWEKHQISEEGKPAAGTNRFSHGLGVGDINGDGKNDVLTTDGWWEQPSKDEGKPWVFHKTPLGEACADMYVLDIDGDGKNDVVSSSAHKFGIWWHQQKAGKDGPTFLKHDLFRDLVSETHAMHFVDIDGDGLKDFVTGKRFWSHGKAEPGADKAASIYWLKASKAKDGTISFTPIEIDNDSGIGTQFTVQDINGDGLLDVIVSNKKGVSVIVQERK